MSARVVVTGSEGFVGRHVRAALALRGVDVVGVGRPGSGAEVEVDLARADVDVSALVRGIGAVDGVIYLAANISRTSSVDAAARENLEVVATRAVAWMAASRRLCPDAHFVYASTLKTYGPSDGAPIDPERAAQRPDAWSYGSAKALAERLLDVEAARSGASHAVVRLTYVHGPGQHPANAIPTFLRGCWAGVAPTIFGPGTELRDDVYAPDVAYVLVEAWRRRARGALHAGSGQPRTLLATASACCDAVGAAGGPTGLVPVVDASRPRKAWLDRAFDIERTRALLDYAPTSLAEGLLRQASWIREGARLEQAHLHGQPIGTRGAT